MHRLNSCFLALVLAVLVAVMPASAAGARSALPLDLPVLEAGGFLVEEPFRSFVLGYGGLEYVGQPLTDEFFDEALGAHVQYFTYARLERRGTQVQLSRLGSILTAGREAEPPFQWIAADAPIAPERSYVPQSGHTLGGAFAWYFEHNGGVALLGHPISEEFEETQPDGGTLLVQYFERARLSYHPMLAGGAGEVQRAPLGTWLAETRVPLPRRVSGRPLVELGRATMHYQPGSASGANIELAASRLNGTIVAPGAVVSFLGAVGGVSAAAGFRPGPGIAGGEVVEDMIGGGVCVVSTLLYRVAWSAGLPVIERRGHSRWLAAFSDIPGMDATVVDPGQDLRVRNDSGAPIYLVATARGGQVSLSLWGRGDGRTTRTGAPQVRDGETVQVVNTRVVHAANGAVLRNERVVSQYVRTTVTRAP